MAGQNLSIVDFSKIHDLLPLSKGCFGKTTAQVTAALRRDGFDVTQRQIRHALERMEPEFGLVRTCGARNVDYWKRSRSVSIGHCFRQDEFGGEPLDFDCEDDYAGFHAHSLPSSLDPSHGGGQ